MKILLFGGTFDPPHIGHLALLQNAIEAVQPDLALVMPAGVPPHKEAYGTPAELRYQMCRAFLPVDKRVHRSRFELDQPGKSYTAHTVRHLRRAGRGARFFWWWAAICCSRLPPGSAAAGCCRTSPWWRRAGTRTRPPPWAPRLEALRAAGGQGVFFAAAGLPLVLHRGAGALRSGRGHHRPGSAGGAAGHPAPPALS